MSSPLDQKKQALKAAQENKAKDSDVLCQKFADLFSSELGTEVLAHLFKRFDVDGRIYIADPEGRVDPIKAAIRDGERTTPLYILSMARKANPKFPHP